MLHPYQILMPLLSLFLVRVDLTDLFPLRFQVEIKEVLDGDTLLIQRGNYRFKLRLAGVDAPEKEQPFVRGGSAGAASTRCLKKLLRRQSKHIVMISQHDIYGRLLGDLEGLTFKLINAGCTGIYPHAQFSSRAEKMKYLRAMMKARREGRGIWASGGYRQPKLWRKFSKRSAGRR